MGMAASQVRFLSLQHRKNSIGRQLSTLSNRKMSLSRDMNDVSRHYTEALNRINLKWSNDCGNTYHALTYDMLMKPNDVNCETPYILTNARNGKVLLNDSALYDQEGNKITHDGLTNIGGTTIPAGELSYLDIAKMISSFTGISEDGNDIYCNKMDGFAKNEDGNWVGKANPGAYYIPSNDDFSFDNNLRMKIFMLMGLVTEDQIQEQNSLLTELYGSQEAKESGIYPVGTAWGDYYIALANLEAYDHYLASDQTLSTAGTYKGSQKESKTYAETIGDYTYSTTVNGTAGNSSCIQKTASTGAAGHVDFNAGVVKDETTGLYVKYSSADTTEWNSDAINNLFDDEKYDATINSADTTWGASFTHTLSKNSGMTYTYTYDDVLQNAIFNCAEEDKTIDDFDIIAALNASDDEKDKRVYMYHGESGGLFGSAGISDDNILKGISPLLEKFANILRANTIVAIDEDAIANATIETEKLCLDGYHGANNGCVHRNGDRQDNALNLNGVSISKDGAHLHGLSYNPKRASCEVDVKTLFNTFMTYYNYFATNPTANATGITGTSITLPEFNIDTAATPTESTSLKKIDSDYYFEEKTESQDGTKTVVTLTKNPLTSNSSETEDTGSIVYINTLTDNYTFTDTTGCTKYYFSKDKTKSSSVQYYSDYSPVSYTYVDENNETKTISAYGVITTSDKIYICTTQSELTNYINNNTLPTTLSFDVNDNTDEPFYEIQIGDPNSPSDDHIEIANYKGDTYYDIRLLTQVNGDPAYRKHLVDAVNAAQLRITELEEDIEDFYSDSDKKIMDYYDAIFLRIAEQGWEEDEFTKNDTYLNNKIQNNDIFLTECLQKNSSTGFRYTAKQATNISKIFSVHDTNAEQEALVEYESEKNRLQYKENAIDTRMRILETEQEAINTEMEGIQKVCNDNISKYFKIFA